MLENRVGDSTHDSCSIQNSITLKILSLLLIQFSQLIFQKLFRKYIFDDFGKSLAEINFGTWMYPVSKIQNRIIFVENMFYETNIAISKIKTYFA